MMRRWLVGAAVIMALPEAYGQRPIPWWENPVANGLTLSEAQRDRINRIVSEHRDRLTLERQEAERAEREFESVVNAETFDWTKGSAAVEKLVKARSVFTQDLSLMTLRLRNVLTAEQWRTLQERRGDRDGTGRGVGGRGPEGRGRRGGPPPGLPPGSNPAR